MPHAIVAYFDTKSDRVIREAWKAMADAGVCNYLYTSENNPHIKLGMFDDLDVEIAREKLSKLANLTESKTIHFKNIGIYPGEKPIVFLDISASIAILELQVQIQSMFSSDAHEIGGNYFDPGVWKPDCFLTMPIERERIPRAIDLAMELSIPFNGSIERIGLIEFHPARQLFSFNLMGT